MRLVASMITKNEMERYITLAVEHLLGYCDEVRVLDDGSDDGTFEWLDAQPGVDVLRNQGPSFFEHEGKARQALLDHTFAAKPDYVLAIDADEFVGDPAVIREGILSQQPVYLLSLVEAWKVNADGISIRVDGLWGPRKIPILYAPPRYPDGDWRIADRQLACGREPTAVVRASRNAPLLETSIYHFGWTQESARQQRAERYFTHDQGRFHQDRHLQSILFPDSKVGLASRLWPEGLKEIAPELIVCSGR